MGQKLRRHLPQWICIALIALGGWVVLPTRQASADFFGGDLPLLAQLIIKAAEEVAALQRIISTTGQTVSLLEDMNRGIKEVLKLADTAHIPLPPQVYEEARTISQAVTKSRELYGELPNNAPDFARTHYQSGTEGLFLSQDAFQYSKFLDKQGEDVKSAAVVSNQASATRLTAETLGVVVEAVSHGNRLQAKELEISATDRLEKSQKDAADFNSYVQTHDAIANGFQSYNASDLDSLSWDAESAAGQPSGGVP